MSPKTNAPIVVTKAVEALRADATDASQAAADYIERNAEQFELMARSLLASTPQQYPLHEATRTAAMYVGTSALVLAKRSAGA